MLALSAATRSIPGQLEMGLLVGAKIRGQHEVTESRLRATRSATMTGDAKLLLIRGPQSGRAFELDKRTLTLGRDPRNEIVIDHPQVSRRHARLTRQNNAWVIEDMDSTNGTFVNGTRLTEPRALTEGDTIELSEAVILTYRKEVPAPEGTRQPGSEPPPGHPRDQAPPRGVPLRESAPPPFERPSPAQPSVPERELPQGQTWLLVGAGCFVLFLAVACAAVFALDYFGLLPAFFYEPFRWLGLI